MEQFLRRLEIHRDALTAYCARMLWRRSDLEDALQEIVFTAYGKYRGLEASSDFRAWLFRIATLTCLNINRRSARDATAQRPAGPWLEALDEELEKEYTYEEILRAPAALFEKLEEEIVLALRELNDNERSILLLKTVAGLTCVEIAGVLEIPLGTAQGLLSRARRKTRERLSELARSRGYRSEREPS